MATTCQSLLMETLNYLQAGGATNLISLLYYLYAFPNPPSWHFRGGPGDKCHVTAE